MISELLEDTSKEIELIQLVKAAYASIQRNCLSEKSLSDLKPIITLSEVLKFNVHQAAIFSTVFCITENQHRLTEKLLYNILSSYFNHSSRVFRMEMRAMKRHEFFYKSRNDEGQHQLSIQSKFIQALDENNLSVFINIGPKGLESAMEYFRVKLLSHDGLNESEINAYLEDIDNANEDLALFNYCVDQMFPYAPANTFALYAICSKAVVDSQGFDFAYMDMYLPYGRKKIQRLRETILEGSWHPIESGLVEIEGGNHIENDPTLKLTSLGYDVLLKELDPEVLKSICTKMGAIKTPLIQPNEINKVNLYFNSDLDLKTKRIAELLSKDAFERYQSQFPKNTKMKGLTFLFHGGPGCGKTEFALQLSKLTGRTLIKIQVTDFQSKWVGESESQLKQIFKDYRMACERMELIPILFLNECDQVLGKRVNISNSVDQMSNSLQNILLEEMENFDGILVGTTNLTNNLDSAFERRWVMKLQFDLPNESAKIAIWKSVIKGLRINEVQELVKRFNLTPGEIANISRRFAIEKMLGSSMTRLQTLIQLCETEHYETQKSNKSIGFTFERSTQKNFNVRSSIV